jgi:hypothetical protein
MKWQEVEELCTVNFTIYTPHQILLERSDREDAMGYEKWEIRTKFWIEIVKVRDNAEDLGRDGRITLKGILGK